MASAKRERMFNEYRSRMERTDKQFKISTWLQLIAFGGPLIALNFYYFIKALALLAGAGMVFGQLIYNYALGGSEKSDLTYHKPYILLFYLSAVTVLVLITKFSKKKIFNVITALLFIGAFLYGLAALFFHLMNPVYAALLMVQAFFGFWCSDIVNRHYKEIKFLAMQEGYPDFIDAIGEPVPIANTSGIYMRQYELLKAESKKKRAEMLDMGEEHAVNTDDHIIKNEGAMDEVITEFDEPIEDLLKKTK